VVPKVADILNELAVVVDKHVVNDNNAILEVADIMALLQFGESSLIEGGHVPGRFVQPTIEAGLVGSVDEFGVYPVDGFTLGSVEPGEVFAKVLPLPLILKERTENDK
jgi:hypothetical protein